MGSGTAGAPLGLLHQGGPGNPTTPSQLLISHPDSSRLGAQDAAGQLLLLAPTITVSVGAFRKETLRNNLPCVYPAFH